ncbi:MAG: hypothetical protein H6Q87_253, partial [candidate division NC10 bacterium]|nr:hypothetical protein [candidate division NC10 bacterium]
MSPGQRPGRDIPSFFIREWSVVG